MKNFLAFTIVFLSFITPIKAETWLTSLKEAKSLALKNNKLVLVDFWASWCGPCKRMDAESWSKDEVKVLMNNFVPVKIDIDKNRTNSRQYGVRAIPYIFILDGNGKVIYKQLSYMSKNQVIKLLKEYALNTSFVSQELIEYSKKESFATSFKIGMKYLEGSLDLNGRIKSDLINVANDYFDDTLNHLEDVETNGKSAIIQNIKLIKIQEKLILKKSKRALKMLEKYSVSTLDEMNISLYYFLNYIANKQLNHVSDANDWAELISDLDKQKAKKYL